MGKPKGLKGVLVNRLVLFATLALTLCSSTLFVANVAAADGVAQDASHIKRWIEIAPGRSLFTDYIQPQAGKPTVVLINGLTYRTGPGCWEAYAAELKKLGIGVLMWDPIGQGETLLRDKAPKSAVDYRDQVDDMALLLEKLASGDRRLAGPYHLFGLSYGGALAVTFAAAHPDLVKTLTLAAPYSAPVPTQDLWIRMQLSATRAFFPFNLASSDELYDYFLRQLVFSSYPSAEPIVMENPYKLEATFRLAQGLRKYVARDYVGALPPGVVHLLIARKDQYIDNAVHDELWNVIPEAARMSRIYIEKSEHKIVEAVPAFAAALTKMIIEGDALLAHGRSFAANPATGLLTEILDRGGGPRKPITTANGKQTCTGFMAAR